MSLDSRFSNHSKIFFEDVRDGIDAYVLRHDLKHAKMYLEGVKEFLTPNEYIILNDVIEEYKLIDMTPEQFKKIKGKFYSRRTL